MVEIQDRRERSESRGVNIQKKDTFRNGGLNASKFELLLKRYYINLQPNYISIVCLKINKLINNFYDRIVV